MTALDQLMWALQALAQPGEVQIRLFPNFVCVADELALDFDYAYRHIGPFNVTEEQRQSLIALDELLNSMSGPERPFWTVEALLSMDEWNQIRQLGRVSLKLFGWSLDTPPMGRAIYVHGEISDSEGARVCVAPVTGGARIENPLIKTQ